ncbi:MAG: methyltransferase [Clostridia bacterium]|nr:methyltransferase [Clostridia bacterium]
MTSRELVLATLEHRNFTDRVPRQLWSLPVATDRYPAETAKLIADFPADIINIGAPLSEPTIMKGNPYAIGEYTDEFGCVFTNIQEGVIGEVKHPQIGDDDLDWDGADHIHIPEEFLSFQIDDVNRAYANTDQFCICGCNPRPFEQLQFIRGTTNLYMDLMDPPPKMLEFMKKLHDFYCRQLEKWAKTDVDALSFMDDWGSQRKLLINPALWVEYFKPMYKDYIDIAHSHGKKIFMHSDGNILEIYPHLIELGLDAVNSQLFCMGIDNLVPYRGKITFWGEIDRQHLLPFATPAEIDAAVREVYAKLWDNGGCIAQLEFGPGAKPENAYRAYQTWQQLRPY